MQESTTAGKDAALKFEWQTAVKTKQMRHTLDTYDKQWTIYLAKLNLELKLHFPQMISIPK